MKKKIYDAETVFEEPAFELVGVSTLQHSDDVHMKVYWSDLKESRVGAVFAAEANSSCQYATILFKDDNGVFIRFVEEDHNELTDYEDEVWCKYFDFGRK